MINLSHAKIKFGRDRGLQGLFLSLSLRHCYLSLSIARKKKENNCYALKTFNQGSHKAVL